VHCGSGEESCRGAAQHTAVCRKSYINPVVFVAWRTGNLHKAIRDDITAAPRKAARLALSFCADSRERTSAATQDQYQTPDALASGEARTFLADDVHHISLVC